MAGNSGDLDKDLKSIFEGLEKRNIDNLKVAVTFKIDDNTTFNRAALGIIIPLIIAGMQLVKSDDTITDEVMESKEFLNMLEKLVSLALTQEALRCIERKELKKVIERFKDYADKNDGTKSN